MGGPWRGGACACRFLLSRRSTNPAIVPAHPSRGPAVVVDRNVANTLCRQPRTPLQPLPLPAATVRALSLEQYAASVALRIGYGSFNLVAVLMRIVNLSYPMASGAKAKPDPEPFRTASTVLERCAPLAQAGEA